MDIARPSRKKEIQRRRILYAVGGVAAVALITIGLSRLEPAAREVDRASVWSEKVKRGEMLRSVRGPGTLVPEEIRWISAETDAQVERIVLRPGAQVEPDSIILELTNPTLEQSVLDAELALKASEAEYTDLRVRLESQLLNEQADLARVKADYQGALLEAESRRELSQSGLVSDLELRRAELAAEQLTVRWEIEQQRLKKTGESQEAQLAVKRSELEQRQTLYQLRRNQLDALDLRAGITGILQEVPVDVGQRVTPGTNLARVAQPDKLKAELRISETQAKDIEVSQVAQIDTRNGIVEGRVVRIDPSVQQGTVTVDVALTGELPKGARPDLSVDGTIEIERLPDVLYVGRPAYGQANSKVGLFKIDPDGVTARRTQVQLGRSSVNTVEIVDGLREGDEVILSDSSPWDDVEVIRLK
ncbi:MAG: HlyD family efflux transporter periplasmic adaptor subunit [Thermoanaerobaculia bacterium]|nr:HlyD family efflux transporter periplasmic adaptor subunit [Thermoanaerobaculia bacterium]